MTAKKHPDHWKFTTLRDDLVPSDFKDIPKTGGNYRINKVGVVISKRRSPDGYWIVLQPNKSNNARPYDRIAITFDTGVPKLFQVSRLVLETWVGPPPSPMHLAAYRNGDNSDTRLDNLMWATAKEVSQGQICRGTWAHGETSGNARAKLEQVEAARRIVIDFGVPVTLLATALNQPSIRVSEWLRKTWNTEKWAGLENPLADNSGV